MYVINSQLHTQKFNSVVIAELYANCQLKNIYSVV
jgi:hypothetical protein